MSGGAAAAADRPGSSGREYRLALIVLNYRTPALVEDCLRSLDGQVDPSRERVVVVDNASGDGSPERIAASIRAHDRSGWVELLVSAVNGGFSSGNNLGIRAVRAEAYLLLNSDTVVQPGAIAELRNALATRPDADLIGPRIEWPDGRPECSAFRFPSAWSEFDRSARTGAVSRLLHKSVLTPPIPERPEAFAWASFACIVIRRRAFERIGLLDEAYFLYFEDIDFCRRAHAAGLRGLYWPSARVVHLEGASGPVQSSIGARRRPPAYYYESRNRYFAKFHGRAGLIAANLMWCLGRCISWTRETFGRKPPHLCPHEGRDIWRRTLRPLAPGWFPAHGDRGEPTSS